MAGAHDLIEFSSDCAYDVVCFLCQQCVEKYLKAMLVLNGLMETREEATKAFEVATRIRNLLKPLLQP